MTKNKKDMDLSWIISDLTPSLSCHNLTIKMSVARRKSVYRDDQEPHWKPSLCQVYKMIKCTSEREVKNWPSVTVRPRDLPGLERTANVTGQAWYLWLPLSSHMTYLSLSVILQPGKLRCELSPSPDVTL